MAGIEVWAQHFFYHQYDKAAYREYASKFQMETFIHSCSWDLNLVSLNEGIRQASVQEVVASMRLAKELGAAEVTVHPGHMTMPFHRSWFLLKTGTLAWYSSLLPCGLI